MYCTDDSLKPCLALRTITDAVAAWHLDVVENHHDATGGRAWLLRNAVPGRAGCRAPRREAERVTRVAEVPSASAVTDAPVSVSLSWRGV